MRLAARPFTDTSDERFVFDLLLDHPRVGVVSPCSGHGCEFCPGAGEILADPVGGRQTGFDLGPFRPRHFAPAP